MRLARKFNLKTLLEEGVHFYVCKLNRKLFLRLSLILKRTSAEPIVTATRIITASIPCGSSKFTYINWRQG
jgi:hypothetical protein